MKVIDFKGPATTARFWLAFVWQVERLLWWFVSFGAIVGIAIGVLDEGPLWYRTSLAVVVALCFPFSNMVLWLLLVACVDGKGWTPFGVARDLLYANQMGWLKPRLSLHEMKICTEACRGLTRNPGRNPSNIQAQIEKD